MKRPPMSAGQKATIIACSLILGTGVLSVAALGAVAAVPALFGSMVIAVPLAAFAYVVFLRSEDA